MDMQDLLQEWRESFEQGDIDRLQAAFVEDLVYDDVPLSVLCRSKAELKGFALPFMQGLSNFRFTFDKVVIEGDTAAVEWTWGGTQTGELPPGLPATGKSFTARGCSFLQATDGLLSGVRDYWDALTVLKQLGHVPE